MTVLSPRVMPPALQAPVRRVLYVGPEADEVCRLVTQHVGNIDIRYESEVQVAIALVRAGRFDTIIVDQRDERLSSKLILPLFSSLQASLSLVVVSQFKDVSQYLAVPGVARVLAAPIREAQLLRVLGLKAKSRHFDDAVNGEAPGEVKQPASIASTTKVAPDKKGLVRFISDRFMTLVSTLYKRAAFVLLMTLFIAFTFYGVLIGYFLISNTWGAPMTLARGHELVNKVERELTEARVALGQADQKITEAELQKLTAERSLVEAGQLVKYAVGTINGEIKLHKRQDKLLKQNIGRLVKVRDSLKRQLSKGGMAADLNRLFDKRLISKSSYTASTLGLLEASQRLAAIEGEVEQYLAQVDASQGQVEILVNLKQALEKGGHVSSVAAASPELLLLTKQSVDARAAEGLARSTISSNETRIRQLQNSQTVLRDQIAELGKSVLGRAIANRIDVVFVPYNNKQQFRSGQPLYSCVFTVLWCKQVGVTGEYLPGEVSSVHPFFGKPIRGDFVEAKIFDPDAATRDIIHGSRAPFFF